MYDPVQDKQKQFLGFDLELFIDAYGINRLKFAYIAYNETGVSNINMPLLFAAENGIFAEMKLMNTEADGAYNDKLFNSMVERRKNTKISK
jgi:hypothetical protein